MVKISYLTCVMLKNSNFFWEFFLEYFTHLCIISLKKIQKLN